mmetsp:Transcript_5999/g.16746  ORF Transcript_5999/g.16746 Transcript_5999/m.16746 type:complete len:370 (-) Transcript_5999:368-1477(-)
MQTGGAGPSAGGGLGRLIGPNGRYRTVRVLGEGNFGVAHAAEDTLNPGHMVAIKYLKRGKKIDKNVEREILNHRSLCHPNVIQFREVFLTDTHLAIVMEYAAGGELFDAIAEKGMFAEPVARYFFQQLVCGLEHCHKRGICHRDLKLENTLLDSKGETSAPRVKICDFGYSKSAHMDSKPKSTVGTPAYIAPEVLRRQEAKYSGEQADVWSCGVVLYVMLFGRYPFEDPNQPRNYALTIDKIARVDYSFPPDVPISHECMDLILRIFVSDPSVRITLLQIRSHPWFIQNLPRELVELDNLPMQPQHLQRDEETRAIVQEATKVPSSVAAAATASQPPSQRDPLYSMSIGSLASLPSLSDEMGLGSMNMS